MIVCRARCCASAPCRFRQHHHVCTPEAACLLACITHSDPAPAPQMEVMLFSCNKRMGGHGHLHTSKRVDFNVVKPDQHIFIESHDTALGTAKVGCRAYLKLNVMHACVS